MSKPPSLPDSPCYLNGEYTPVKDAKISVLDRGFIFGDGVYEVIPVYAGKMFRFEQHMARLDRSLAELRMQNPRTRGEWQEIAARLIDGHAAANDGKLDQLIYIQITRGVAMRDHVIPQDVEPTVFAMASTMKPPTATQRSQGVACITANDFRWQKAHIKSVSLLGAVFARQLSHDAGAAETVMFREGYLSEAASSNVWVVKGNTVYGAPRDHLVLEGIRYGLIADLCESAGIRFELRRIPKDEVLEADELLLTSATKEILPVTLLDGAPVGNGKPGPIYSKLYAGYQRAKEEAAQ